MSAIQKCRTAELGSHRDVCENCGTVEISCNSCRNRHCPKCQTLSKERWIDNQKRNLLNVGYFHVVFTVPDDLRSLIYQNQPVLYNMLFQAVHETLKELAANKKYLGAEIGFTSVLHTWGKTFLSIHTSTASSLLEACPEQDAGSIQGKTSLSLSRFSLASFAASFFTCCNLQTYLSQATPSCLIAQAGFKACYMPATRKSGLFTASRPSKLRPASWSILDAIPTVLPFPTTASLMSKMALFLLSGATTRTTTSGRS